MKEFRRSVWIGFIWSIVFGTMLHFLYGWTGENRVVGLYAAVSESTWEHLKLLFFPVLLYTVWEYIWLGHRWKGYVQVRAEGVLLGMLTITALFYTYTGICGRHWLWADILTFVLGAAVTAYYTWKYARRGRGSSVFGAVVLAVIASALACSACFRLRWEFLQSHKYPGSPFKGLPFFCTIFPVLT